MKQQAEELEANFKTHEFLLAVSNMPSKLE